MRRAGAALGRAAGTALRRSVLVAGRAMRAAIMFLYPRRALAPRLLRVAGVPLFSSAAAASVALLTERLRWNRELLGSLNLYARSANKVYRVLYLLARLLVCLTAR